MNQGDTIDRAGPPYYVLEKFFTFPGLDAPRPSNVEVLVVKNIDCEATIFRSRKSHENKELTVMDTYFAERPADSALVLNMR